MLAVVVISYELKRYEVFTFSTYLIFIFLGIFIFNFPSGKIFLGDSGAYLLGLYLSIILITLFDKGQNLFSFVIVQIIIYPAYEIFRSIIRRLISKKDELFRADNKHLHSILYAYNLNHFSFGEFLTKNYPETLKDKCIFYDGSQDGGDDCKFHFNKKGYLLMINFISELINKYPISTF